MTSSFNESSQYCVQFAHVQAAAGRIAAKAHRTPVLTSASLNRFMTDGDSSSSCQVFFKVEALQKTGSFKFRGALNAVTSVMELQQQQQPPLSPLHFVTHSSGNHAQALALASAQSGSRATIRQAVADFGAEIVLVEPSERAAAAERIRQERNATLIHPSEDPRVIAGQGTVCLEMVQQVKELLLAQSLDDTKNPSDDPPLDAVIIPVGGGGLAAGNIVTLRALLGDKVQIILAEPTALDDAKRSFDAKQLLGHAPDNPLASVADGLKTTLGPNTWPIVRDGANAILTVSETEILRATKLVWERLKIAIEPSAGVGVAVLLSSQFHTQFMVQQKIRRIGVILCGGNVDIIKVAKQMQDAGL